MFSAKVFLSSCLCIIVLATKKSSDLDNIDIDLHELFKDGSESDDSTESWNFDLKEITPIPIDTDSWNEKNVFPNFDDYKPVPKTWTAILSSNEKDFYPKDYSYNNNSGWPYVKIFLLILFVFKIIGFVCYRSCHKKKQQLLVVRERSVLIVVEDPQENSTNPNGQGQESQVNNSDPEDKPPSYDDSVVINPLPTYDELMKEKQTSPN